WTTGCSTRKRPGACARPPQRRCNLIGYFNELLMEVNFSFRFVPRPFTAAMIASEIPAAISPYSIAVAPDSSLQKPRNNAFISFLPRFPLSEPRDALLRPRGKLREKT